MARPRTDIAPRILLAARRRFLKSGVDGATLRAIARDAGTSIGMIYYYFPTKEDLFFAVVEQQYAAVLADMELALSAEHPVEERLQRLYERISALRDEEAEVLRLVAMEGLMGSLPPRPRAPDPQYPDGRDPCRSARWAPPSDRAPARDGEPRRATAVHPAGGGRADARAERPER
jgi:AcrR family transcriptional regulator